MIQFSYNVVLFDCLLPPEHFFSSIRRDYRDGLGHRFVYVHSKRLFFHCQTLKAYRSRLPLRYFWVSLNDRSEFQIIDFVRLFVYSRHTPPSSDSTYHRIGESIRVFPAPNHQCWTTGRMSPQCNRKESVTPHVPMAGTEPGLPAP